MLVISFVTQKGGTGKSTLISSLAVAAREAGERVAIFDLDPQQALMKWRMARTAADIAVEALPAELLEQTIARRAEEGVTLCLIDTTGVNSATTVTAIDVADLCIIPVRPNAFDLWAGEQTRHFIRKIGKASSFLLNQCPVMQQNPRVRDGIKALEAIGGLLSPAISARVDFQDASRRGRGVTEIARTGQAAEDIRQLWVSILRLTTKAMIQAAA